MSALFVMFGGDGKLSKRDEFGLNPRQRAFADEYIINKGNAYQAAIKAGYSEKYAMICRFQQEQEPFQSATYEGSKYEPLDQIDAPIKGAVRLKKVGET